MYMHIPSPSNYITTTKTLLIFIETYIKTLQYNFNYLIISYMYMLNTIFDFLSNIIVTL
jgi:hypothetical protein